MCWSRCRPATSSLRCAARWPTPSAASAAQGIASTTAAARRSPQAADGDVRRALTLLEIAADLARRGRPHRRQRPWRRCWPTAPAASTRAASSSTTRSRRCTSRCAAPIPMRALYWLARMLDGGCDPTYLARRLTRMAVEDIGLADPRALAMAIDAWETYERLGSPEGELALAQLAIYLASCAEEQRRATWPTRRRAPTCASSGTAGVPMHLRNAPTKLMKGLGYGKGYQYDHDADGGIALDQTALPDGAGRARVLRAGRARPGNQAQGKARRAARRRASSARRSRELDAVLLVMAGGALGAGARFLSRRLAAAPVRRRLSLGHAGLQPDRLLRRRVAGGMAADRGRVAPYWRALLMVGLLGGADHVFGADGGVAVAARAPHARSR